MKNLIKRIILTIVFALIWYYIVLPPINLHAFSFYLYLIFVMLFFILISMPEVFINMFKTTKTLKVVKIENKVIKNMFFIVVGIIPLIIVINFILSPVFNSKAYYY